MLRIYWARKRIFPAGEEGHAVRAEEGEHAVVAAAPVADKVR